MKTTLQQIKQAYAWNYGCIYKTDDSSEERTIINILDGKTFVNEIGGYLPIVQMNMKGFKLIGFRYLGELGGNEPIPEGQKFRVKGTGEVYKVAIVGEPKFTDIAVFVNNNSFPPNYVYVYKGKIEPYFES